MADISPSTVADLKHLAGEKAVVDGTDAAPLLTEWRGRWKGKAPLVLAPGSAEEVAAIMAFCHANRVPVVPQGGNTGLVGGQVPQGDVLLSTTRLSAIRDVDPEGFTLSAEAGVPLQTLQETAAAHGRLFPLSIGSEGSCRLGGILSTNAGGVHVIRYGNMRDLVLGIEVVLPDGRLWSGMNRLRKNNTGYDLKHLFIGGEGTLGIVTAAVLRLFPQPVDRATAFLALPSPAAAVDLLSFAQERSGGALSAFELMTDRTVDLILHHFPDLPRPLDTAAPAYVLLEFEAGRKGELTPLVHSLLSDALERSWIVDGTVAQNTRQAEGLWSLRHRASEAMKKDPSFCVKCDISVPIRAVPPFLEAADRAVDQAAPGARVIAFGHMGDGNIHYDILGPEGGDDKVWRARAGEIEHLVHDVVAAHEGSISAEHGIGLLKREELPTRKPDTEIDLMRTIKAALDPHGLMNPGKLL